MYRPDPSNPNELALQQYIKSKNDGIGAVILEAVMMVLLPKAILSMGKPDPAKAMKSILALSHEIDEIYVEYALAGLPLPSMSRVYGFNLPINSQTNAGEFSTPQAIARSPEIQVTLNDEDSWDEIERPIIHSAKYDLES